ncbi:hypothetical protein CFK37_17460 [Virgibacillus phasianinus]|uniref:Uncharacterized protein n=1 Tax=Virgibacillus phasianinus TaxID=2017483 RepID=A0A220U6R9_9BACI|nr:hypothetical protein [Virgibacillus phasianinus]ASK63817.1 hypothetical protein CFK37_17460 [Virgibacillus phasianinus]
MFEFLMELPMDLQFYVVFMSALLPLSFFVVNHYLASSHSNCSFAEARYVYEKYITKSLQYNLDSSTNDIIIFISNCIRLKDSPNDGKDDHQLLLTH